MKIKVEPITKEVFYKIIGKPEGSIEFESLWFKPKPRAISPILENFKYYRTDLGPFVYISDLQRFLVPKAGGQWLTEEALDEMEISLENWEITKVSYEPGYEKNMFHLFDVFFRLDVMNYYKRDRDAQLQKGNYDVCYKPESIKFNIGISERKYFDAPDLAIPEMLERPMNYMDIKEKLNFLKEIILWKRVS